ncbi:hypothetical protein AB0M46_20455 [Dactylosporangium sp. NPDC051485]|uniref:hypothetical protein n=1 Tax=Dactylosporangium sp. NPDC051485 TaxID=3154846 RepID=UPI003412E911
MSTFPFAMVVSQAALAESFGPSWNGEEFEYASALPGAPVVAHEVPVRPPRVERARWALAESLRRAADAVAPVPAR